MLYTICYTGIGYLSGSILFARLFGRLMGKDVFGDSSDKNPGTFNAFRYGGFWCGVMTLCGDLLKGFLPVYMYLHTVGTRKSIGLAFVLAAPVLGHILPLFHWRQGGKGIAVTFGCLLGLMPEYRPALILAMFFIFFSLVFKITPNYYRTLWTYVLSVAAMKIIDLETAVFWGFFMITGAVMLKLIFSKEQKEKCEVRLLWKH